MPNHESGLVQCWKDATWACQGPHSNDCGGPVIAGSGDGPCSHQQGGLGMYQLDAWTYAQTLASYGHDVVELDPQISKGVDVIIQKVWHCPNTHYTLDMQTDGNLVLYHAGVGAIWATGTNGKGGHSAAMQSDGNSVLYTAGSKALWASGTNGHSGSWLDVQDDGNLVVYGPGGKALWDSHTNGK